MKRSLSAIAVITVAATTSWFVSSSTQFAGAANTTPAGLITSTPTRVLNTRTSGKLPAGGEVVVNTGVTGAVAVVVNITITDAEGDGGFVTAWTGGARPDTSIINAGNGQTLANAAIVPVNADGTFRLFTYQPANLLVDLLGHFPGSVALTATAGFNATITGYNPLDFGGGTGVTYVSGTVSNGTSVSRNLRVDVQCPNGSVATDTTFSVAAGAVKGFQVSCNGVFTAGASVKAIVEV